MLWHPDGRRLNFGLETGKQACVQRVWRCCGSDAAAGDLSLWMAPAYNFETIFNFSACPLTSMSFSHNQVRLPSYISCLYLLMQFDAVVAADGRLRRHAALLAQLRRDHEGQRCVCSVLLPACAAAHLAPAVHTRAVRDISFSPTDAKFATCSDDSGLKVFDFDRVSWRHGRDDNRMGLIRRGRPAPVSWRSRRQWRASGCLTATT